MPAGRTSKANGSNPSVSVQRFHLITASAAPDSAGENRSTIMNLFDQRADALKSAQAIVNFAKAASRDLTDSERTEVTAKMAEIERLDTQIDQVRKSTDLINRLAGVKTDDGSNAIDGEMEPWAGYEAKSANMWAKSVATTLGRVASGVGVKALLNGEIHVPPAVSIEPLPAVPTSLLDLIARTELGAHTYSYLRQTLRDENVAPVADNSLKPTSIYTFHEVEGRAKVIAHLSEPFPLRYLSDYSSLAQVLDDEMKGGIRRELENQVVNGDGTGENFLGIMATTGVHQIPFTTDRLTTVRAARTTLAGIGVNPNAWVLNPADVAQLELMREDGATGGFLMAGGAYDVIFGDGIARVASAAIPAGTALLADWSKLRLRVREQEHTLAATQAGDLFSKNQVMLRAEGRFDLENRRPEAIAVVDLTA